VYTVTRAGSHIDDRTGANSGFDERSNDPKADAWSDGHATSCANVHADPCPDIWSDDCADDGVR